MTGTMSASPARNRHREDGGDASRFLRVGMAFLAALAVPACSQTGGSESGWWNPIGLSPGASSPPPATGVVLPTRSPDPVAAFAARAQPGQSETIALSGGSIVNARLARAYNAASGRECREVQFGATALPAGSPGATYCNDPVQGWVAARSLLRGGAVYRP